MAENQQDRSSLECAGRLVAGGHHLPIRVYYEDTDFSGMVYHANYLKFCERGRSDFLRHLNIHHHEVLDAGTFTVRRMVCDFLKPARIDDLVEVETCFAKATGARLELKQVVSCRGQILFTAEVTIAFVDRKGRPTRLPQALRQIFLALAPSP